jgi:hypothetical protein
MHLVKITVLAVSLLLVGVELSSSNDQQRLSNNTSLGRRVFQETCGQGKSDLVDQVYAADFVDDSPGGGQGWELIKEA